MTRRTWLLAALAVLLAVPPADAWWLDPHADAREGNRLYAGGKYEDAATKYNQALVDDPDSDLLHFNLGDASYKHEQYEDALAAFQQVPADDADPARTARVAYNIGNTKYRLGAAKESSDPQAALGLWAEALAAYRRALGAAPDDGDAKFNHEFVEKKIADLQKKLEEQKKQQEQQQQQQQEQQDQPQDQQGQDQQQARNEGEEKKDQPTPGPDGQQQQPPPQPAAGQPEQKNEREMSPQEATALLDSQRDQEVRPDEVIRKLQGAVDAEPAQDW